MNDPRYSLQHSSPQEPDSRSWDALCTEALDTTARYGPPPSVEDSLAQLLARAEREARPSRQTRIRHWPIQWAGIAIVAVLCGIAVLRISRVGTLSVTAMQAYRTTTGQISTITLRDGSRVTLAPNSSLQMAKVWGANSRDVILHGAAYFDVVSTARAPFVVRTGNGTETRVLGTTFTVAQYPGDRTVRVAVISGRVRAIPMHGHAVTVGAGMMARLVDSTAVLAATDVTSEASWMSGALVFDETPIPEVLATLSRWYGMQFRLADPALGRDKLSARFDVRSPSNGMAILTTMLDVTLTFEHAGDTTVVTLHPQTRRPPSAGRDGQERGREYHTFSIPREVGR